MATRLAHDFHRIPVFSSTSPRIQAKLTIDRPGDRFEQEADRVADAVMAGSSGAVSRVPSGNPSKLYRKELAPEDRVDSMPAGRGAGASDSDRQESESTVQRSAAGPAGGVSPSFESSVQNATRGGGEALSSSARSFMEGRFGHDFTSVRIHDDSRAHALARQVNARAFTLGKNIFFGPAQYRPESRAGRHLLAHELTHVLQQDRGGVSRRIQRMTACSSYSGYDTSIDLKKYNCAGLATRTYRSIAPPTAVINAIAANFSSPSTPGGGSCGPGQVKFWLWEYDLHFEDDRGTVLSAASPDFHIVAGLTDSTGADPTDVYSKNGKRKVYGPGTGPGFRPPTHARALSNDPSETPLNHLGRPVYKRRSNMTEAITCADCT